MQKLWDLAVSVLDPQALLSKITGVYDIEFRAQPSPRERRFGQNLLLVTTQGQGAAFYDDIPIEAPSALLGRAASEAAAFSLPVQIAVLDSLFAACRPRLPVASRLMLDGTMSDKAPARARFICAEAVRQLRARPPKHGTHKVALVGVSALHAQMLAAEGLTVAAWDNDPTYVGMEVSPGIVVNVADAPESQLRDADVALVTGMTLSNGSLEPLARVAERHDTRIVLWSVTGANLAPYLIDSTICAVISETFPYYFFPGRTQLDCYRRVSLEIPKEAVL